MSPAGGSEVARGTTVTLTVAKEPEQIEVPDVLGEQADDAADLIEAAGFRVRGREQKVDTPEGDNVVLEQNPPSGEKRDEGSRVTITIGALRAGEPRPRPGRHALADALRVVVLAGGRSSEHDVSLDSAATVTEALRAGGHEVETVLLERDGGWTGPDGEPLALAPGGGLLGADVVFPVLHGPFGEDGTIQGLLELLDVAYVGAGVLASSLCMDKIVFKEVLAAAGVPQVAYAAVLETEWRADAGAVRERIAALGLPVFVKPARLGSSVGHLEGRLRG